MQRIVPVAVLLVAALATFAAPAPAVASNATAAGVEVVADLDGVPISVAQIPSFYCHDGDFPQILNRTGFRGDPGDWISRGLGGRA